MRAPVAMISGAFDALILWGRPRSTTSIPRAASAGVRSSNRRSVRPSRFGCTVETGSPTKSTDATRASSTSGWARRRRISSAPP